MEKLINDIISHIKFLETNYNLEITICDLCSTVFPYFNLFAPYTAHHCPVCVYLKKYPQIQKICVQKQSKIREKCLEQDHFKGSCYVGIGEYIFRIMHGNVYIGFISVGEFCFNKSVSEQKLHALCDKFSLPFESISLYYNSSVKTEDNKPELLKVLINPLQRMMELLYSTVVEHTKANSILQTDDLMNSMLLYLNDNYTNNISLNDIAHEMHYSKSYLCHYFFSKRNMTIMYYICTLRIQRAKKLLAEDKFSISEIAFQIGFNDANYFTNTFKKFTGMSPLRYKKACKTSMNQ